MNYVEPRTYNQPGGVATNIGIHFFDLLIWLFGKPVNVKLINKQSDKVKGELELENAFVKWELSIDKNDLPEECRPNGKRTYRSIKINGEEI
ncbi:MAG: Gfo/Idh/MocA family oxidoreductase [Bacteroidota bacterium]|jgi:UDP-N-acetyl-2-amino-2-deoxyglucuronate dehydrogenase